MEQSEPCLQSEPSSEGTSSSPAPPTAGKPRRARRGAVVIPDDLLDAARRGLRPGEIARRLSVRLGREVCVETVWAELIRVGLRPAHRPAPPSGFTAGEKERLAAFNRARRADTEILLTRAAQGDRDALITLYEAYKLRLPLVEARMSSALPWMEPDPQSTTDRNAEQFMEGDTR